MRHRDYVAHAELVTSRLFPTEDEIKARETVSALLANHSLKLPPYGADNLIKTVLTCRVVPQREKQAGKIPRRKRMCSALKHAQKLREYTIRAPSHKNSIPNQLKRLQGALNDDEVVMWLANARPRFDASKLLTRRSGKNLGRTTLDGLIRSLQYCLAPTDKPDDDCDKRRPFGRNAKVIGAAYRAWIKAGKDLPSSWNDNNKRPRGPLVSFTRDLLNHCNLKMSEDALGSALRIVILRITKHSQNRP